METETRVRPFSCGSQYMDWEHNNCDNCTKSGRYADEVRQSDWVWVCDIQKDIGADQFGDGTISADIATRMGCDPGAYGWRCGELDPIYPVERWFAHYASPPKVLRPLRWRLRAALQFTLELWIKPWNREDHGDYEGLRSPLLAWKVAWGIHHDDKMIKPGWTRPPLGEPIPR